MTLKTTLETHARIITDSDNGPYTVEHEGGDVYIYDGQGVLTMMMSESTYADVQAAAKDKPTFVGGGWPPDIILRVKQAR